MNGGGGDGYSSSRLGGSVGVGDGGDSGGTEGDGGLTNDGGGADGGNESGDGPNFVGADQLQLGSTTTTTTTTRSGGPSDERGGCDGRRAARKARMTTNGRGDGAARAIGAAADGETTRRARHWIQVGHSQWRRADD